MNAIKNIALAILIVGGLNWGLVGFFNFNLVAFLFDGFSNVISRIIYALVGVAGITTLIGWILPNEEKDTIYHHSYSGQ